jgi:hypothetical protein
MVAQIWIIIAFIVIAVYFITSLANKKQAIALKLLLVLFFFFMVTIGYVWVSKDVDLTSFDGIVRAVQIYLSWLGHIFVNAKSTAGYVVHQDWAIEANQTLGH